MSRDYSHFLPPHSLTLSLLVDCEAPFVFSDCGAPCEKQCALQGRPDLCSGVRECTPGCYCPQVKHRVHSPPGSQEEALTHRDDSEFNQICDRWRCTSIFRSHHSSLDQLRNCVSGTNSYYNLYLCHRAFRFISNYEVTTWICLWKHITFINVKQGGSSSSDVKSNLFISTSVWARDGAEKCNILCCILLLIHHFDMRRDDNFIMLFGPVSEHQLWFITQNLKHPLW